MKIPKRVSWKLEDEIFAMLLHKYNVVGVDGSALNPYCIRVTIPISNNENIVRNFANELFHELEVLDGCSKIDFGETVDYCRLEKDDEGKCYYVAFNHHRIVGLRPGDDGYEYSVAAEYGASEDEGDEFGKWGDGKPKSKLVVSNIRPSAKRRAEIEKQIADAMNPYRIVSEVGEINPYCYNVRVDAGSADEAAILDAFNNMFHALGVLPENETLDVGDESDYCEIYATSDAYFAPINDPLIIGVDENDENYKYVLKVVRANFEKEDGDSGLSYEDDMDDDDMLKEVDRCMQIIAKGIKSGEIRSPSEEGCFILGGKDFDSLKHGERSAVFFEFNPANLVNSIGIKAVCLKRTSSKEKMRYELKSVRLLNADDRECDPYNIPPGFFATTIAIHLGKRIG